MRDPHDSDRTGDLVEHILATEAEDAQAVGSVGYLARALVQAALPHRRPEGLHFQRTNGAYTLSIAAGLPQAGLPYGSTPRLLLAWLATEAVRRQDPMIPLGDSLADFMRKVGLPRPTGGARGSITQLKRQAWALFSSTITCSRTTLSEGLREHRYLIARKHSTTEWWGATVGPDGRLAKTIAGDDMVTLSDDFFREVVEHAVPIDLRALGTLRRSPMALDLYTWLTYQMYTIVRPTTVPWEGLRAQFGAGYPNSPQGMRDFRKKLRAQMRPVLALYPSARVAEVAAGVELRPSPTHVGLALKRSRRPLPSTPATGGDCGDPIAPAKNGATYPRRNGPAHTRDGGIITQKGSRLPTEAVPPGSSEKTLGAASRLALSSWPTAPL